jgi:hypothetical protein
MPRPVSDRGLLAFIAAVLVVWAVLSAIQPAVVFCEDEWTGTLTVILTAGGVEVGTLHLHLKVPGDDDARFPGTAEVAWRRLWSRL